MLVAASLLLAVAAGPVYDLAEETARQLVQQGLVRQLPDLFDLRAEQLLELEGFAELSANKFRAAVFPKGWISTGCDASTESLAT